MTMDRLSNMLSMIKNASMVEKKEIEIFYSKQCEAVANVLKAKGFLSEVKVFKPKGKSFKMLNMQFSDDNRITNVKIVSTPGRRIYSGHSKLRSVAAGKGLTVISTSRGVMDGDVARKKKLGGEVICEVI